MTIKLEWNWFRRSMNAFVLLQSLTLLPTQAQQPAAVNNLVVWEREIMSQPYDQQRFRQVRIPDWVKETIGCGYTLSVMDSQSRKSAVEHGVTISEMGFVNPFFACYDSKYLKKRSPDFQAGRIEQEIAEYERLGVRILAVYPPCLQGEVYENHPEWRRIDSNTTQIPSIDMVKYPHGGMLCLLGPYGDFMIDVLAEIVQRFPEVDAFSFDGLHYGGVCYCQHCRESYRKDTGKEIPNIDMNDDEFRRYQHWADRRMESMVQRMQVRLKGLNPEIALVTWTTNAGRFGHFLSIPRNMPARMNLLLDAPDQEFWLDETNRGATIVPAFANAYIWATTNHRVAFSEPYLLSHGNPYGKDSFPAPEIERRMMLALTYGAAPSIAVAQPGHLQNELYECMDKVRLRREWLTNKEPERWAAMVMSDNTRNFYGRSAGLVEERYLSAVFGTFRAAVEEHLPLTIINDWNLNDEDLSRYRVLVLPNTACLDQAQLDAIERYVKNGGGLVASQDTSLFDEFGTPRDNFGLSDVFGVRYQGVFSNEPKVDERLDVNFAKSIGADYWEKRKNVFDVRLTSNDVFRHEKLKRYIGLDPVTMKGPAVRVVSSNDQVKTHATISVRSAAVNGAQYAIFIQPYGKGRVVYFAAGFDSAYYLYSYPYQRLLIRDAIEWAANSRPPIQVQAPMCVHASFMRQKHEGGNRLLVHLFNDVNTTAQHAFPNDDVPLREETLPIHGIRITFDKEYSLANVTQQPENRYLPIEIDQEGKQSIVVPQLDVHSVIVSELR